MISWIQSLDWAVLDWIQHALSCGFLDTVMPWITRLGNGGFIWILAALLMISRKKYRRNGVMLLCGLLCGVLIGNLALKNLVARPRPCWLRPEFQLLLANPKDFSFPSGHTLSSVIAAGCLARTDRRFGAAAIPLAALIAFSRLYLFVHFPSDVLASVVLGVAIAWGMDRLFAAILRKRAPATE
ncbi:MAG: phosphatase PAP2 family protein [Eubacteriales bacterium]|nr:phosphatase PAP2 family protein [Eubacteriales bacterium]